MSAASWVAHALTVLRCFPTPPPPQLFLLLAIMFFLLSAGTTRTDVGKVSAP